MRLLLRVIGTSSLLALIFVIAPRSWMMAIHEQLGMGSLPDRPVVWYLARSTSALYAIFGGLFWVISFDLRGYRPVLVYLGVALTLFGLALLAIDWQAGMPRFWRNWEGPFVVAFGLAVLVLNRRRK